MIPAAFFIYLLEVVACSALFAGYYWWILRNGRFYRWNRFYIVTAVVLSIIIPLMSIPMPSPHVVIPAASDDMVHIVTDPDEIPAVPVQPATFPVPWAWLGFISCIFVIFLLLAKEIVSFIRILRLKHRSYRIHTSETDLYCTDDDAAPFTFFRTVFWKEGVSVDSGEGRCMLRHELAHVRLGHSWDKALMQLVCCMFWMNPFFMLLRRELELVHEFAADSESVDDGNVEKLSSLILCTLYPNHYHNFTSCFFQSSIKRRIIMMSKSKKSPMSLLRKMSMVPVVLVALYLFACKTEGRHQVYTEAEQMPVFNGKSAKDGFQEYFNETSVFSVTNSSNPADVGVMKANVVIEQNGEVGDISFEEDHTKMFESQTIGIESEKIKIIEDEIARVLKSMPPWTPGRQGNRNVATQMELSVGFSVPKATVTGDKTVAEGSVIYTAVEEMPLFEGKKAEEGFRDYLGQNTVYPHAALENGISGRVFVEFVIDADGYLKNAKILRSIDPLLDAEALRVIKESPKWTPGYRSGEPVAVKYGFPIVFKLQR
jgi:TonB family protein